MTAVIPLGSTCGIAYQLQTKHKRQYALPFDWLRIDKLEDITSCMEADFKDFVTSAKPINNTTLSRSDKFPLSDSKNDNFPTTTTNTTTTPTPTYGQTVINKYNMKFYHDFTQEDISTQLEAINLKYKRRITRFIELIKESQDVKDVKEVIFIRDELKPKKNISVDMIENFVQTVKNKYNNNKDLKIRFILVIHNPKNKPYKILATKSSYITVINDTNLFGDWKRPNIDLTKYH